ncbi:N-acetylglucosamine-6-phosphate deacetylase [Pseudogracilibacillus sp. SE30717A]|uniref:N-acetylglucosamine-6-phosphate deacetylase n=1 Tax=Pseudogracilibacillus sp. SE30717A TaxID=3098293 RepID=UPI00300E46B9
MSTSILIQDITIYTEDEKIENGFLLLKEGKIVEISKHPILLDQNSEDYLCIDGEGLIAIPGFIDGHIHGAAGADTMDASEEALDTIATCLPKEGTTSFLATTMTQSNENIEKALRNIACYENKAGKSEVVGIHLEGPFINEEKKGAQPAEFIHSPNVELMKKWQEISAGMIKTITLAPECDGDGLIPYLEQNGYNISAGHSSATFEEIKQSVSQGVAQLTHLCNAMTGLHHRDIGAVGAAFLLNELKAEIIADEIHTSEEMLQIIYNNIGSERLLLISDAIRAKSLPDGAYELGGQPVTVLNGRATLEDGTLAGSILKMDEAAKNMLKLDGVTIRDIIKMSAENPAKQINIFDQKGSITVGKDADILLLDEKLAIKYTICRGIIAYEE